MTTADSISLGLTIVTAVVAIATGFLAFFTFRVSSAATEGNRQTDRHYQQNLRPFCVIEFADATRSNPFGTDFDPEIRRMKVLMSGEAASVPRSDILIRGTLHNKANGLAKNIIIYINARLSESDEDVYRLTSPVVVSGLVGAKENIELDVAITSQDTIKIWDQVEFKWKEVMQLAGIPQQAYEVVLEYEDVFGNFFRTVHPRGIRQNAVADAAKISEKSKQHEMMLRPNRPMPIFLTGRQSVRTLADAKTLPQTPEPL